MIRAVIFAFIFSGLNLSVEALAQEPAAAPLAIAKITVGMPLTDARNLLQSGGWKASGWPSRACSFREQVAHRSLDVSQCGEGSSTDEQSFVKDHEYIRILIRNSRAGPVIYSLWYDLKGAGIVMTDVTAPLIKRFGPYNLADNKRALYWCGDGAKTNGCRDINGKRTSQRLILTALTEEPGFELELEPSQREIDGWQAELASAIRAQTLGQQSLSF